MRYKKHTRAEIDRAIHDANIANLSHAQTIQFVAERTGITVGHTQLVERRRLLRNKAIALWNEYRKDDYAYRLEHLQRVSEARLVKEHAAKKEMEFFNDEKKFFQWKTAAYTLMEASRYLNELQLLIPEIDAIGNDVDQEISQVQSEEQGTIHQQKGRVF